MRKLIRSLLFITGISMGSSAANRFQTDTIPTSSGNLLITFIGHGSLILTCNGKIIHVDPWGKPADYSKLPDADIVLITHAHQDHLDQDAIKRILKKSTVVIGPQVVADEVKNTVVMNNGDQKSFDSIYISAVPAYNIVNKRDNGQPYHPKGEGNGYVITLCDKRIYIAGDTENIPEMKDLDGIDIAFLPMNLPYTMTPEMVADAARTVKPKILYPYHYGDTDPAGLTQLLKSEKGIEIRIREMR